MGSDTNTVLVSVLLQLEYLNVTVLLKSLNLTALLEYFNININFKAGFGWNFWNLSRAATDIISGLYLSDIFNGLYIDNIASHIQLVTYVWYVIA